MMRAKWWGGEKSMKYRRPTSSTHFHNMTYKLWIKENRIWICRKKDWKIREIPKTGITTSVTLYRVGSSIKTEKLQSEIRTTTRMLIEILMKSVWKHTKQPQIWMSQPPRYFFNVLIEFAVSSNFELIFHFGHSLLSFPVYFLHLHNLINLSKIQKKRQKPGRSYWSLSHFLKARARNFRFRATCTWEKFFLWKY